MNSPCKQTIPLQLKQRNAIKGREGSQILSPNLKIAFASVFGLAKSIREEELVFSTDFSQSNDFSLSSSLSLWSENIFPYYLKARCTYWGIRIAELMISIHRLAT
ncbi:hypothetical protein CEXT_784211 [Caerostris extrusa]|uniref:Uncharacterized protein n=1 Tax=Caerostris extrusa TaxID=172846 RepID=A0AAV4MK06_CAEEX|nr:hypothetical protein CEXT_784211 [Caerostris extrusa]